MARRVVSVRVFNPESEAEPPGFEDAGAQELGPPGGGAADGEGAAPPQPAAEQPSVLNKLQKWADYAAVGAPVWPTKFIPCKTPMSQEILDNWSLPDAPKHPLTVPLLLEREAAAGRQVGLIIDLANHDCLYSDDVPETLEYEHVQLIAKVLPSREAINEVERIARSFWADRPDAYIGVHCAYGFNRTGFVVCSYLCQACGLTVDQALESFAAARPPGVKHERFVRELYGSASQLPTPEGSVVLGMSPPAIEAVDALAAQAELLLQNAASKEGEASPAGPQLASPGRQPQASPHRLQQASPARQQQEPQRRAVEADGEEDAHFEDAADTLRCGSLHRRSSQGLTQPQPQPQQAPPASPQPPGPSPQAQPQGAAASRSSSGPVDAGGARYSQPGSGASSRSTSLHRGGSDAARGATASPQQAGAGVDEEGVAITVGAADTFQASRRLLQRQSSRGHCDGLGAGGLSLALADSTARRQSPSVGSQDGSVAAATSPTSASRTAQSSFSDFAAAAVHLEGAASMRRSTSLGLAKALCEDFLQNNGTPSGTAPIAAVAQWDEQQLAAAQQAVAPGSASGSASPEAHLRSGSEHGSGVDDGADEVACWVGGSPTKRAPSDAPLGSSPSKRGGIPLPRSSGGAQHGSPPQLAPARAASAVQPVPPGWQQPLEARQQQAQQAQQQTQAQQAQQQQQTQQAQQQQTQQTQAQQAQQLFLLHAQPQVQPGTPATPASSGTPSALGSSFQRSVGGGPFLRSVSVDSDNPSLGFGAREALMQLRAAGLAAPGVPDGVAPERAPQALSDLFREDSSGELALDVDDHLQALASHGGLESPAASTPLPKLLEGLALSGGPGRGAAQPSPGPAAKCVAAPVPGRGNTPSAAVGAAAGAGAALPPPQPVGATAAGLPSHERGRPKQHGGCSTQ